MIPKLSKPNNAERAWIATNLASTRQLVAELSGASDLEPSALDVAYATWFAQHDVESEDPNPIINAFGIAFGQYLVDQLQLKWVVASDEHGTEMAVHGQPGDILVYPPNLVAKRYSARETDFFAPLFCEMQQQIDAVRSQTPARRWWKFW
jgi:hypothetical protein